MQQQHNEGVGYNGHTVIQPLSHSFKVGKPPNSLFLDTMDFLTMEVVAIVWLLGAGLQLSMGQLLLSPASSPCPTLLPAGVSSLDTTRHTAHIIITSQASLRTNPGRDLKYGIMG